MGSLSAASIPTFSGVVALGFTFSLLEAVAATSSSAGIVVCRIVQLPGLAHADHYAFDQPVDPVDYDSISFRDAAQNVALSCGRCADLDGLQMNFGIRIHHIHEGPLLAILDGHIRDHKPIVQRFDEEANVYKLLWE